LARIAVVIRDLKADIVALQEVDHNTRRSGKVDQAKVLGRMTGMQATFGAAMDLEGGHYGVAILSRNPLVEVRKYALPGVHGRERRAALVGIYRLAPSLSQEDPSAPARREAQRDAVLGRKPDYAILIAATHLENQDESLRLTQIDELKTALASRGETPALLLGDLNSEPGSPSMLSLLRQWTDASAQLDEKTFPSDHPSRRIDYVLYRPSSEWRVIESRVIEEPEASDHRPLLVVMERTP